MFVDCVQHRRGNRASLYTEAINQHEEPLSTQPYSGTVPRPSSPVSAAPPSIISGRQNLTLFIVEMEVVVRYTCPSNSEAGAIPLQARSNRSRYLWLKDLIAGVLLTVVTLQARPSIHSLNINTKSLELSRCCFSIRSNVCATIFNQETKASGRLAPPRQSIRCSSNYIHISQIYDRMREREY